MATLNFDPDLAGAQPAAEDTDELLAQLRSALLANESEPAGYELPESAGLPDPELPDLRDLAPPPAPDIPEPVEFSAAPEPTVAEPEAAVGAPEPRPDLELDLDPQPEAPPLAAPAEPKPPAPPMGEPVLPAPVAGAGEFEAPPLDPGSRELDVPPPAADSRTPGTPSLDPGSRDPAPPDSFIGPGSRALDTLVSSIDQEARWDFRDEMDAQESPPQDAVAPQDRCIVFSLAGARYAIPIRSVLELDALPQLTTVPNVPGFVRGVANLRGEIIAVLDLRALLGLGRPEGGAGRSRILVVRSSSQQIAALAVDDVRGAAGVALSKLTRPAGMAETKVMPVLLGIGEHQDRLLSVLDVDKLFATSELRQLAAN